MTTAGLLRSIVFFVLLLVVGLVTGLTYFASRDRAIDYPVSMDNIVVPEFDHLVIDYIPSYDNTTTIPFTAGALIDINGDGIDELFIGGGSDQEDALYQYANGSFNNITAQSGWTKKLPDNTFSAISLDLDRDGDSDLLVSRQSGVYVYHNTNGKFTAKKLVLDLDAETVPLSVAVADINRDGLYDMYVSGYIAREFVQGETIFNQEYGGVSGLYINTGDDTFDNITVDAGMYYKHNTFQSVFVDIDQDELIDLVVAHDTGQIRTWKNLGNLKFESMPNPSSDVFSYPMGIAVTDLGNNQSPDFFFSNVGTTVPTKLVRGDLNDDQILSKDWFMFQNQGSFKFEDVAEAVQLARYEFSWGAVFEDFNLDGLDDLAVSENYEGWPLHKVAAWRLDGRFLLQSTQGKFVEAGREAGVRNRHYGIAPLSSDFNQDGYPDLVHVNLLGPQNVFMSKGGAQGYLKVELADVVDSIGAQVTVTLDDDSSVVQYFIVGEGLCSDQSHVLTFGLGDKRAKAVSVKMIGDETHEQQGDFHNQRIVFGGN